MTEGQVLDIVRDAIYNIIICAAPLLLISLIVGLIVPNIVAVFLGMLIFGAFILTTLTDYMTELWTNFSTFLG